MLLGRTGFLIEDSQVTAAAILAAADARSRKKNKTRKSTKLWGFIFVKFNNDTIIVLIIVTYICNPAIREKMANKMGLNGSIVCIGIGSSLTPWTGSLNILDLSNTEEEEERTQVSSRTIISPGLLALPILPV